MGGKPHTSRGCNECRKQKVKCDGQIPECARCLRRGFICSGPRKASDLTFVSSYNASIPKKLQPRPMAKPRKSLAIEKRREDLLPVISLSPIIHMEPMVNEQLLSAYLGAYFPDLQTSTSHRWPSIISNIMGLPQKGALLQHTCAALPRIYFGRVKLDTALFHDGLNRFNHAIRLFSKSISRNSYTEDVVHAAVIFQEIKTYDCSQSVLELYTHIEGLNAVVQHQASKAFKDPGTAKIYIEHAKQRTLFWLFDQLTENEIRFVQDPYDHTPLSGINWSFSETARLRNMLNGVDQSNRESCLSLFNGWRTLQTFLTQLYLQIEPTGGNIPTYAPGELPTGLPLTDNIFGRAYRFNSLDEARLHTLLFTLESFFYQMFPRCIRLTKAHHPDILPNSINLTDWEIYGPQMAEYYAYESARCLPYCATRGMGSEGTYYAPHCLFNVFRICSLTRNLEALVWCDKSFEFIERSGNDAAGRLREYLWSQWCGADKDIALAKGGVYRKVGDRLGHMNP